MTADRRRAILQVEQLEERYCPAPVIELPDGRQVIVLSPSAVIVLEPLIHVLPAVRPGRPAPARITAPRRPSAPARPTPRHLQFREIGHTIELYLPRDPDKDAPEEVCPFPNPFEPEECRPEAMEKAPPAEKLCRGPCHNLADPLNCDKDRDTRGPIHESEEKEESLLLETALCDLRAYV